MGNYHYFRRESEFESRAWADPRVRRRLAIGERLEDRADAATAAGRRAEADRLNDRAHAHYESAAKTMWEVFDELVR